MITVFGVGVVRRRTNGGSVRRNTTAAEGSGRVLRRASVVLGVGYQVPVPQHQTIRACPSSVDTWPTIFVSACGGVRQAAESKCVGRALPAGLCGATAARAQRGTLWFACRWSRTMQFTKRKECRTVPALPGRLDAAQFSASQQIVQGAPSPVDQGWRKPAGPDQQRDPQCRAHPEQRCQHQQQ